jgi:hypothetical protein
MYAQGVPVSKNFLLQTIAAGKERARRIANTQVQLKVCLHGQ